MFTPKTIREYNVGDAKVDRTNPYHGVMTLSLQSKGNDAPTSNNGSVLRGPGRPPIADISLDDCIELDDPVSTSLIHLNNKKRNGTYFNCNFFQCREQNRIQRIGAQFAIQAICTYFGADLPEKVPIFWTIINNTIQITEDDIRQMYSIGHDMKPVNFDDANELITCLQLIECAAAAVHPLLIHNLLELLPKLNLLLKHPLKAVISEMISRFVPLGIIISLFVFADPSHVSTLLGHIGHNQCAECYEFDH